MDTKKITALLKKEMVVAMGCTEPAASALAGGKATELLGRLPEKITVYASRDMIKNVMGVGIPNCDLKGIQAAVCLGACGGDPEYGLSILSVVTEEQQRRAAELAPLTQVELISNVPPVYIRVVAEAEGHVAECTVAYEHDRFTSLILDGKELAAATEETGTAAADILSEDELGDMTVKEILEFANSVDVREVDFVLEGAYTNMALALHAQEEEEGYGLSVGKVALTDVPETPATFRDAVDRGAGLAAGASDARMSGCPRAVVINSGSGNQGITCSVPVLTMASYLKASEEKTVRALCVSQLTGLVLTARKDRLSALCGAFTAAIGAGCGYVYLMDGGAEEMDMTIRSMVANLTGIVCDGAKQTCALKIYSCVEAAGLSCLLAFSGKAPGKESGIVGGNSAQTIRHLARLSHEGMTETDRTILSIMLDVQ